MSTKVYNRSVIGHSTMIDDSFIFPGPMTHSTTVEASTTKNVDTFTGVDNPRWKDQIRYQLSATTPASGLLTEISSWPIILANIETNVGSGVTYQYRSNSFQGYPTRWVPGNWPSNNVDTNTLNQVTAAANSLFVDRAKSAISSFQSGQDLVELKQTIESVIHPLSSLRKHVETYFLNLAKIKGKYKSIRTLTGRNRSLAKALSDTYLEWTFGWAPLALDIAQGITDLGHTRFNLIPVHAKARRTYQGSESSYVNTNATHCFITGNQKVTSEYVVRLKGAVNAYYQGTPPTLRQELQLLPEDFAPTLWNVLPYSFVIDYFLNVGDIINAYSFPSAALRWCNKTARQVTRTEIALDINTKLMLQQYPPPWVILGKGFSASNIDVSVTSFTRSAISAGDLVSVVVFELPKLSSKPWRNIAALVFGSKRLVVPYTFS